MEKTYRRLRAKMRRKSEEVSVGHISFLVRMLVCLVAFLVVGGIKLRGGEMLDWTESQMEFYMSGATEISTAYHESVEAVNQLCDRIIEAQNQND